MDDDSPWFIDSAKAESMWIASTSARGGANYMMSAKKTENGGMIEDTKFNENCHGLRPVICLKGNTGLQKQIDGSYSIK